MRIEARVLVIGSGVTGADLVCTPCVNCYDAIDNLARDYGRPWRPIRLWKLLANAIVIDSAG